jgi:hypothetical protein
MEKERKTQVMSFRIKKSIFDLLVMRSEKTWIV